MIIPQNIILKINLSSQKLTSNEFFMFEPRRAELTLFYNDNNEFYRSLLYDGIEYEDAVLLNEPLEFDYMGEHYKYWADLTTLNLDYEKNEASLTLYDTSFFLNLIGDKEVTPGWGLYDFANVINSKLNNVPGLDDHTFNIEDLGSSGIYVQNYPVFNLEQAFADVLAVPEQVNGYNITVVNASYGVLADTALTFFYVYARITVQLSSVSYGNFTAEILQYNRYELYNRVEINRTTTYRPQYYPNNQINSPAFPQDVTELPYTMSGKTYYVQNNGLYFTGGIFTVSLSFKPQITLIDALKCYLMVNDLVVLGDNAGNIILREKISGRGNAIQVNYDDIISLNVKRHKSYYNELSFLTERLSYISPLLLQLIIQKNNQLQDRSYSLEVIGLYPFAVGKKVSCVGNNDLMVYGFITELNRTETGYKLTVSGDNPMGV